MDATAIERAAALDYRAQQAALTAAYARHDGLIADAELWEDRAARLESMAADYRRKAN